MKNWKLYFIVAKKWEEYNALGSFICKIKMNFDFIILSTLSWFYKRSYLKLTHSFHFETFYQKMLLIRKACLKLIQNVACEINIIWNNDQRLVLIVYSDQICFLPGIGYASPTFTKLKIYDWLQALKNRLLSDGRKCYIRHFSSNQ